MRFILISLFLFALIISCKQKQSEKVSIIWKNNKAVSLAVPVALLKNQSGQLLKIQLDGHSETDVLGQVRHEGDTVFFDPLVPFTRGLHYKLLDGEAELSDVEIPVSNTAAPQLLSIYPTQDTVPENLLKMYLHFSQPMEEGHSLSHITLFNDNDTLKGTFLDLQPELWNNEGTVLTLWLDPGRIKRDLIPNKEMGTPLRVNQNYALIVDEHWKSKDGKSTTVITEKKFFVTSRDEQSPVPNNWRLSLPGSASKEPLIIHFMEPLDFSLANESITIRNENGELVNGSIELIKEETQLKFLPDQPWISGHYLIKIESRMEDLAGNNLNRVFDKDLTKKSTDTVREFFEKDFIIR